VKIVHFLPALIKGGGERVAADLANAAASDGHEVTVLAAFHVDENLLRNRLSPEIDVRYLAPGVTGRFQRYLAGLPWIWKNWAWLASQDILHCHLTQAAVYGTLISLLRRMTGGARPAVVETYHAVGMPIPSWHRWLHAWMCARRDGIVLMAKDDFWSGFMRKHPDLPSALIANGVDATSGKVSCEVQLAYRKTVQIPESCELVLGTVGQFRSERKPHIIAGIFSRLAQRLPNHVHFLMVGAGAELKTVHSRLSDLGLAARIHTPGIADDPRVPMSVMDLYLTLNVGPITGIAALEAAFAGIPIIALQLDADYKPGDDDWIWSHHDPQAIADHAAELLSSAKARDDLARRQHDYVEAHCTLEAMHAEYSAFYACVLAKRDRNRQGVGRIPN